MCLWNNNLNDLHSFGKFVVFSWSENDVSPVIQSRPTFIGSTPAFYESLRECNLKRLGNRLKYLMVGGTKVSPSLFRWLKDTFEPQHITVYEGYSSSETSTIAVNGAVSEHVKVRLLEDGEICVHGDAVIRSYVEEEENENKKVLIDNTEFWRTGDIGEFDWEGRLWVKGRKSSSFKLSNGEFVNGELVEGEIFVPLVFV